MITIPAKVITTLKTLVPLKSGNGARIQRGRDAGGSPLVLRLSRFRNKFGMTNCRHGFRVKHGMAPPIPLSFLLRQDSRMGATNIGAIS